MALDAHKNFSFTTVTVAPVPATSGTAITVADASVFPAVPFNATVNVANASRAQMATTSEIVRVTLIAANVLTITRAQESTAARTVVNGDEIAATVTAKTLTDAETNFAASTNALGTAGTAGAATTGLRSDATVAAFDATVPTTQAFGDAAAVGVAAFAARRDHKHAMPAHPVGALIYADITLK